ncbi:amino acid adenylation domain-containing protein [Streptomyces violaceoruber]|uniref:amino acid adenylation domain-containing protein n=1 Tax=Streptomyces TaxID=1883 RepID=UPI0029BE0734|nr:amino acid adenylation domain-containing protein [Streptomyces sp. ME03-5684b]MDX3317636.1 amino acid adenylation domain-containing protein [Streptomyces sp. ME03-5684b]
MSFLHDLLTAQAASAPTRTAALLSDSSATYGQVETEADRVAAALVARGVRPGSRVGLHMSRSLALLPALFGILRAGGVCVPVDPEDPDERRATILEYSGATLVVTERALLDGPAPDGTRQLAVEDLLDEVSEPLAEPVELAPDALAFIFYTSGSTGTPKGVMLTHRALLSGQRWLQRTFPLEPGDRQLLRTTLSITNLVREVFWPVLSGGTVVIVPPGDHKDPDRLVELINNGSVTTLMVVPALLSGILENPGFAANTSLKYVFCSSDVMPGALPEKYFATGLSARLFNVYGLTEALYSTYWECLPGAVYDGFVPVGHPAELTPRILDAGLAPVPPGETGELCLAGVGMAEGYDRLPRLTAEKFADTEGGRVFRTGDLARQSEDGRLELLGRMDDQVKIAGYRVELGEVEARLLEVPGVTGAVASGLRGAGGHQRLVAHLTCDGEPPTAAAIRAHLGDRLPYYMVPAAFTVIDAIPLTHNGKVDRRSLHELPGAHLELAEDYTAARNELESYLCALWAETLDLPAVGIHDNFFALGGDSIQGFLISAKANRDGIGLSATQVFATPTVAETAAFMAAQGGTGPAPSGSPDPQGFTLAEEDLAAVRAAAADPDGIETVYPLTEMQKGMLFHSLLDPDSGVYFEQFLYAVDGEVDLDAYHRAWQQVVDRHEILRVWIATKGLSEPLQAVQRTAELGWTVLDWSERTEAEQKELLERYLDEDRRRGFPYERAPLFRLTMVRLGATTYKLVMSYHHLILDAWSLFVLLRDSLEIYHSGLEGRLPELRPTRSFGDYVSFLEHEDIEGARDYWLERLAGFRRPTVIGRSAQLGLSASSQEMHAEARLDLGEELTERLLAYGRANQLTLNSLVQGAWAVVVGGCSGQDDVCFGITITHRPVGLAGVEDIVGIFINSLPMRVNLEPEQPVGRWLQQIQRTQVAARSHDHYPLPLIQQRTDLPSGQPLFESLLIFENFPRGTGWTGRGGLDVRQERYVGWTNYPFAIEAMPEEQLFFQVKYDLAFFDAESVERILGAFRGVLEAIADGGTTPVGKLAEHIAANRPGPAAEPRPADTGARALFPARGTAATAGVTTAPTTEDEIALAAIWAEVLQVGQVDVHTPFLALGGSSLAAMRLVALAQAEGFDFELSELFAEDGTVHRLAADADGGADGGGDDGTGR